MSTVKGSQFTLYTGDGLRAIGCEESCVLTEVAEEIITTTKGSGGHTNREYGVADWTVQSNGVVSIQSTFDGTGTTLDPLELGSYIRYKKKVVVKFLITDGTTTKWLIGKGIVTSCVSSGSAGEFMLFDVTIKADGRLFESDNIITRDAYDGPETYIYTSSGTVDGFAAVSLENASTVYFVHRSNNNKTYLTVDIQTLALATDIPTGTGTVGYHAATGTFNFEDALLTGQIVTVCYDPV